MGATRNPGAGPPSPSPALPSSLTLGTLTQVQSLLRAAKRTDVEVEVVFPVAPKAIATPQQRTAGAEVGPTVRCLVQPVCVPAPH